MGSKALAGNGSLPGGLTDENGVSLSEAMTQFGLDPSKATDAAGPGNVRGFLEIHIEQGPYSKNGLPVGVVTDIAGARRFEFIIEGKAGHSGIADVSAK